MNIVIEEGYSPGCIGNIAALHAQVYHRLVGFGVHFEAKVATELSSFCTGYVKGRDGLWLALRDGRLEGSIAIDGSQAGRDGAGLRWFITSDAIRGSGTGKRLLAAAMDFCLERRYERIRLWTFEGLHAARHLYESAGFMLVHEQRGTRWGTEVNEQRMEYAACPPRRTG